MKHYIIYRYKKVISKVDVVPETKSPEEVSELIKVFNDNEDVHQAELLTADKNTAEVIDFLIKDRDTDKNKLLDVIKDLQKDIENLNRGFDGTAKYIVRSLKLEKQMKEVEQPYHEWLIKQNFKDADEMTNEEYEEYSKACDKKYNELKREYDAHHESFIE